MASRGESKTRCSARVSSTAPRFEPRCPPVVVTVSTMKPLISEPSSSSSLVAQALDVGRRLDAGQDHGSRDTLLRDPSAGLDGVRGLSRVHRHQCRQGEDLEAPGRPEALRDPTDDGRPGHPTDIAGRGERPTALTTWLACRLTVFITSGQNSDAPPAPSASPPRRGRTATSATRAGCPLPRRTRR